MMPFDTVVIGGGPGGYVAAIRAAQLGGSVCLVEADKLGGTCTNRGCIPTKVLASTAHLLNRLREADKMGIDVGSDPGMRFERVAVRRNQVVDGLRDGIGKLLKANKITFVEGRGILAGPGCVRVGEREYSGKTVILATGSVPSVLPVLPLQVGKVMTSDEILTMDSLPSRMVIVGGGVIGCEFASIYRSFGVQVTVVELLDRLLPTLDPAISTLIGRHFRRIGIEVYTGTAVEGANTTPDCVTVLLPGGKTIECDLVLVSVGRKSRTAELNLPEAGVKLERGSVAVNEHLETSLKGVYAIGDAVGKTWLAHTASAEGEVAAGCALGKIRSMRYDAVPSVVFTDPEMASVGLLPAEAKVKGIEIAKGRFYYAASGKALCDGVTDGVVEIFAEPGGGRILGGFIVGEQASSMIAEVTLAVRQGLRVHELSEVIHAHPTLPEMVQEAAQDTILFSVHKAPTARR